MFCSSCGSKLTATARFCPSCGQPADLASADTLAATESDLAETLDPDASRKLSPAPRTTPPTPRRSALSPLSSGSDPIGGGRFAPGQVVADRYRIVALAGRGGMGEVYRADDLKLSQVVAIKFLPESLTQDPEALARFHSEVRIARQVSHPNVCRVFDIGDTLGVTFLTMEYVDGEDLASLLRRIGRVPPDKAVEIARQICAGLAAAHDRGVIHRDLKPANLMLDGAGKIRITDFGLAGIAASIQGAEVRAGTPAYMAPEQLAGKEVTVASDLYSFGLVFYEILTGKRAFDASTLPELLRLRETSAPASPSSLVRDLDPLLERVILRCLQSDPALRPASALQVAAALPGGDPLAAALAAGETPSPQMVAAAGETSGLAPRLAIASLAIVILGTLLFAYIGAREDGLERINPTRTPEVLAHNATDLIHRFGYSDPPVDSIYDFEYDSDLLDYFESHDKPPDWNRILAQRPSALQFWFRQSPRELFASGYWSTTLTPGVVTLDDPPLLSSGMINLELDQDGRLTYFQAMPPEKDHAASNQTPITPFDWTPLFLAAGLDLAQFHSSPPVWTYLAAADVRAAWDGLWPGSGRPLHVEAGAWRGRPVFFWLTGPWTKAYRMPPPPLTRGDRIQQIVGALISLAIVGAGAWFAFRNWHRGRTDRQGAFRLALAALALELAIVAFRTHFTLSTHSFFLCVLALSTGIFVSAFIWMLYLALEPYVRRRWPQTIISWSRLLAGRIRDPLVGRDVLFGCVLGTIWCLVFKYGYLYRMRLGAQPPLSSTVALMGIRESLGGWLATVLVSLFGTLLFFFALVLLRVLVRNSWIAAALFVVIFAVPKSLDSPYPILDSIVWGTIYIIAAIAVVRFGLIVLGLGSFMANLLLNLACTTDFSHWYAWTNLLVTFSFVAIAAWAFFVSLGGKKLWKDELLD